MSLHYNTTVITRLLYAGYRNKHLIDYNWCTLLAVRVLTGTKKGSPSIIIKTYSPVSQTRFKPTKMPY